MLTTPGHEKPPGTETPHARPRALSNDRARTAPTKRRNAMSFSDHKITAFTHRIADLPDQPNLPADELKARFDSGPEELRTAHNAVCDDADRLEERVSGIIAETFGDTIDKSMLSTELAAELDAKAVESSVASRITAEQTARESADDDLQDQLDEHAEALAEKVEIYIGTYTGTGENATQRITLPVTPKAVLVSPNGNSDARLVLPGYYASQSDGYDTAHLENNVLVLYRELNKSNGEVNFYMVFA